MFKINKEDMSLSLTRGDSVTFDVQATQNDSETPYVFQEGDYILFKVGEAKGEVAIIEKKVAADAGATSVQVSLAEAETKFGNPVSKPVEYWYEISLVSQGTTQTLVGYDEDGPKILRLFPEVG